MNIKFINASELIDGIEFLSEDLGITITENSDITITAEKIEDDKVSVSLKGKSVNIAYSEKARFFRGLAYAVDWLKNGETDKEICEKPLFKTDGAMFDMSRNAVMNVRSVKLLLRKMALMGLNAFMLYTEDTYEIDGYPYFGHLRGRYSKAELKELDKYALTLGIELVPCIQTLGHLATHLALNDAGRYKDGVSTLLVGSEETYKLIDAMLKTVTECFTTKRVHIGMDETFDLGTGNYLELNGYKPRDEIYLEHMKKVRDMTLSYGLKPMMWSDMIFRHAGKNIKNYIDYHRDVVFTPEVIAKIPQGVAPVFWDYYNSDQEWYDINVKKHQQIFNEEMLFAGGIWTWSGYCTIYSTSFKNSISALNALKENNVRHVFATVWHNGCEGSHIMALAGLAWYASFDYNQGFDMEHIKETFRISCNESYDNMMMFELPEKSIDGVETVTRALTYNDPLLGIADKHIPLVGDYYKDVTKKLSALNMEKTFKPACQMMVKLSSLLENKGDFGVRLKSAYDKKDKNVLSSLLNECDVIIKKITELKNAHRASWFTYNKPFGWEVHDLRYGGLLARFDTVKLVLTAYLNGEISSIPELEEDRLSLRPNNESDLFNAFRWSQHSAYTTAGYYKE